MQSREEQLQRKIGRRFQKAMADYHLLDDGDKVLVALSGGKDSLLLLEMMAKRSRIHRPYFEIEAVHVRMTNINYETDTTYIEDFAQRLGIKLHILTTSFDATSDKRKSPCFLCSWYRRKALFHYAQENNFNKIALGHHQDDIMHTLLMNIVYQGQFSSMPASLKMSKMPLTIIRPLCLVEESDIKEYTTLLRYEKQKKTCPYEHDTHRQSMKQLFDTIEQLNPEARYSIWHALEKENKILE